MTAQLLFHKPRDPQAFLVTLLQQIKTHGTKPLLDSSDLETMFGIFDVTNRGVLTKQQAYRALKTVLGPEHRLVKERIADSEDDQSMINKDAFVASLTAALAEAVPKIYD